MLAAVAPGQIGEIQATCHEAGVKAQRILLRPCAAAALYCRARPAGSPGQIRLLIDLLSGEADLTVLEDQTVVFLRSARMPGSPLESVEAADLLSSEIRRTMAAAQNLLGGRRAQSLLLFGTTLKHNGLREPRRSSTCRWRPSTLRRLEAQGETARSAPDSDRFRAATALCMSNCSGEARHRFSTRGATEKTTQNSGGDRPGAVVLLSGRCSSSTETNAPGRRPPVVERTGRN